MTNLKDIFKNKNEKEAKLIADIVAGLNTELDLKLGEKASLEQVIEKIKILTINSKDVGNRNINQALDVKGDENDFSSSKLKENQAKLVKGGNTSANQGILVEGRGNKGVGIEITGNIVDEQEAETKNYAIIVVKEDNEKYFTLMVDYELNKKGKVVINWTNRSPSNNWKEDFYDNEEEAKGEMVLVRGTTLEEKGQHTDNSLNETQRKQIQKNIERELGVKGLVINYLTNKDQVIAQVEVSVKI